jgi:transcriptional regulator GlxA family with amidase domain
MLDAAETMDSVPDAYRTLLRDGLITLLLSKLASSVSTAFSRPAPSADPLAVRRAQDYMAANVERALSMVEIAAASGVSLRSLQDAYRKARGVTLGEGLLMLRLERFHRSLIASKGKGVSVADAAFASGFGHLGRAAAAYREHYGEAPSETLRRHR